MIGAQKISELTAVSPSGTEYIPCIIPDGLGGWTNGRVLISGMGSDTNLSNTDLTQTLADAVRLYDINGNILQFDNGQVSIGTPLASNAALEVNNNAFAVGAFFVGVSNGATIISTTGVGAQIEGVIGVQAYSSTGNAIRGIAQAGGLGGKFEGGAYVETYGFGGSANASAVFEAASTTKGALIPRMTTTQMDAIPSPATGLEIYNTTTNRKEFYNGTYWQGHPSLYSVQALTSSPGDAQTVYFGNLPKAPTTTANISKVHIKHNGVIRKANIYCYAGTAGTSENWSLYIRINGTTDYLIETIGAATNERIFNNESLNIPVVEGDYFEIKAVNPTWVTNPLTTIFGGNIVLE
jgi:hypothetical protein